MDQRYKGTYPSYKMDPKYRVSIPPAWRPQAGEAVVLMNSREYEWPVVKVMSQEAYGEKVERVKGADDLTARQKDEKLGRLAMLSRDATLNDQGKLLIPKEVSEKAGLGSDSEVALAGRGNYFVVLTVGHLEALAAYEAQGEYDDPLGIF